MAKAQNSLFDTAPQPWELDDQDDWLAARIVFAERPYGPYDYSIPAELEPAVKRGVRIEVPLGRGNRKMTGYCIEVIGPFHELAGSVNPGKLKPIQRVVDAAPLISTALLELANWISQYYVCELGIVIETIIPTGVRNDAGTREMLFIRVADDVVNNFDAHRLTPLQKTILQTLDGSRQDWTPRELGETVGCTQGPISTLRRRGLIITNTRRVQQKRHDIAPEQRQTNFTLNPEQQTALDAISHHIETDSHKTFLLHGITGSGKTEVYIQAIQKVVEFGRQAIVLVPEISLTPQTRQRFRARFDHVAVLHSHLTSAQRAWHWKQIAAGKVYIQAIQKVVEFGRQAIVLVPEISLTPQTRQRFRARFDHVAVLHSHLTSAQRAWHWKQIAAGKVQVIIGARSAIFAPTPRLGLIVLDEEHDGSFKQDKAPVTKRAMSPISAPPTNVCR